MNSYNMDYPHHRSASRDYGSVAESISIPTDDLCHIAQPAGPSGVCARHLAAQRRRAAGAMIPAIPLFMKAKQKPGFDANVFLRSAGAGKTVTTYQPTSVIFSQGDAADSVLDIQKGAVKLAVLSAGGKEAVVAMLGPGDSFSASMIWRVIPSA